MTAMEEGRMGMKGKEGREEREGAQGVKLTREESYIE